MSASMLMRALRRLHPARANRRPVLFILEVAAALLSVLALRDGILGGSAMPFEALSAAGLWGGLLAIACGLALRHTKTEMSMRQAPGDGFARVASRR